MWFHCSSLYWIGAILVLTSEIKRQIFYIQEFYIQEENQNDLLFKQPLILSLENLILQNKNPITNTPQIGLYPPAKLPYRGNGI